MAKIKNDNICMSCIGTFADKDVFWVTKDISHQVLYCLKCLKEKGITQFTPYLKPRKKKEKVETTVKKKTIKKEN
jgi:hypothetical protein